MSSNLNLPVPQIFSDPSYRQLIDIEMALTPIPITNVIKNAYFGPYNNKSWNVC